MALLAFYIINVLYYNFNQAGYLIYITVENYSKYIRPVVSKEGIL